MEQNNKNQKNVTAPKVVTQQVSTQSETVDVNNGKNPKAIAASGLTQGIVSLVFSIVSFFIFGWLSCPALVLSIGAIVTGAKTNKESGMGIASLILGIVGTIVAIIAIILWIVALVIVIGK